MSFVSPPRNNFKEATKSSVQFRFREKSSKVKFAAGWIQLWGAQATSKQESMKQITALRAQKVTPATGSKR